MTRRQGTSRPQWPWTAWVAVAIGLINGPAQAGPPFLTDDPEPVEYGHWEIYAFSQGTHFHGNTSALIPGMEVNYGAVPDMHLHLGAALGNERDSTGGTHIGFGDTELGVKYRLVQEDAGGWRPMVGVFPMLDLPTGSRQRGFGTGHAHGFLPVWMLKSFGDWTTYGGGGYGINPGEGNRDYWIAGWLLQRKLTDQLVAGGELFHQSADTGDGRNSSGFNLGGIYDVTEHHHLLLSAGRSFQSAAPSSLFSWYLGYQLTF